MCPIESLIAVTNELVNMLQHNQRSRVIFKDEPGVVSGGFPLKQQQVSESNSPGRC